MTPTRIVRRAALRSMLSISMSSIYRLIARGEFPAPVRLTGGQAVGWDINDVEAWIASRKAASQ